MAAPIEPVSLTIGAVALAGLFTTCVDCLDMIDAGRNFSPDLEIVLAKLEAQRAIFLVWGSTVGLDDCGKYFNEDLLGPPIQKTIRRLLFCIISLFEDSKKFRKRYGLKKSSGPNNARLTDSESKSDHGMNPLAGIDDYRSRIRLFQRQSSLKAKVRWAVHDKNKFTTLVSDLKDLIDQLRDVTSSVADLERQRQMLAAEISSISDCHSLEVLEEALREDEPELSDVASQRIVQLTEGSALGTNAEYLMLGSDSHYVTAFSDVPEEEIQEIGDAVDHAYETDQDSREDSQVTLVPSTDESSSEIDGRPDLYNGQRNYLRVVHERNEARFRAACLDKSSDFNQQFLRRRLGRLFKHPDAMTTIGPETEHLVRIYVSLTVLDVSAPRNAMLTTLDR